MKVVLHIGAHRTGTTTFQDYMRRQSGHLAAQNIAFWGPRRTRKGLFAGIQPVLGLGRDAARRARGRILLQLDKAEKQGVETLVISDENIMGTIRQNLRTRRLYADVGERLSRYVCAFDGRIDTVMMSVRALDHYWSSAAAYGVGRGHSVPGESCFAEVVASSRTWCDVIADVSCATFGADIQVLPFERFAGKPNAMLRAATGIDAPADATSAWLNRAPGVRELRALLSERGEDQNQIADDGGRWVPFDRHQRATLAENYADDIFWLAAGANGLATLTEDWDQKRAGQTPPFGPSLRGQSNDQERRMAQSG